MTKGEAIRLFCLRCQGWYSNGHKPVKAVKDCIDKKCSLYPYRLGKDPARQGVGGKPSHKSNKDAGKVLISSKNLPITKEKSARQEENHYLSSEKFHQFRGAVNISETDTEITVKVQKKPNP